jgi:hypothetical protein
MTKKNLVYLFSIFLVLGFILWKLRPSTSSLISNKNNLPSVHNTIPAPIDSNFQKAGSNNSIDKQYVNVPTADWKKKVEDNLRSLAGNDLKEIEIQKERSVIINRDNHNFLVESVVIKLTNNQNSRSSFRAMIDPQTGKILETWDRTVFDPVHVREGLKIKLDPRYTN